MVTVWRWFLSFRALHFFTLLLVGCFVLMTKQIILVTASGNFVKYSKMFPEQINQNAMDRPIGTSNSTKSDGHSQNQTFWTRAKRINLSLEPKVRPQNQESGRISVGDKPKSLVTRGKVDLPPIPFPRSPQSNLSLADFDGPRLWIHVEDFKEGIANWRTAFAEVLIVARALNATVVEPCILRGYLTSCNCCQQQLRLGDIYDMDKLKEFHPSIVPLDTYEGAVNDDAKKVKLIKACMHSGSPPDSVACGQGASRQPVINYFKKDQELEHLLESAVEASFQQHTILELVSYKRGTFIRKPYRGKRLVGAIRARSVSADYFIYRHEHHDIADNILSAMGIKAEFDVIHWRAEVQGIHYMSCAEEIQRVRTRLNATKKDVILLSSLNNHTHLQWSGTKRYTNEDSKNALGYLLSLGFQKTDTVWEDTHQITDVVLLAVWDLILAAKADQLATCSGGCGGWCRKCGHLGNFAQTAIQSRLRAGRNLTYNCWPPAP